jgi:hypothetical protein
MRAVSYEEPGNAYRVVARWWPTPFAGAPIAIPFKRPTVGAGSSVAPPSHDHASNIYVMQREWGDLTLNELNTIRIQQKRYLRMRRRRDTYWDYYGYWNVGEDEGYPEPDIHEDDADIVEWVQDGDAHEGKIEAVESYLLDAWQTLAARDIYWDDDQGRWLYHGWTGVRTGLDEEPSPEEAPRGEPPQEESSPAAMAHRPGIAYTQAGSYESMEDALAAVEEHRRNNPYISSLFQTMCDWAIASLPPETDNGDPSTRLPQRVVRAFVVDTGGIDDRALIRTILGAVPEGCESPEEAMALPTIQRLAERIADSRYGEVIADPRMVMRGVYDAVQEHIDQDMRS